MDNNRFILKIYPIYFLYIIIWAMLILRDYIGINFSVYIFTAIITCAAMISSKETIVKIGAFLIPLSAAVNIGMIYGLLSVVLLIKILSAGCFSIKKSSVLLVLIMIFELLHFSIQPFSFATFVAYLCTYLFIAISLSDESMAWADSGLVKTFIFSVIVSNLLILGLTIITNGLDISNIIASAWRVGTIDVEELKGEYYLYNNSNNIAIQSAVAISALVVLLQKKQIKNTYFFIALILLLTIGLLTISRTFIITCLAIGLWTIISSNKENGTSFFKSTIIFLIVIVGLVSLAPELIDNVITRFQTAEISTSDSSRMNILRYYMDYMQQDIGRIIGGIGMQSHNMKTGYRYVAHNMILDVYVSWGIIGLILTSRFIISLLRQYGNGMKNKIQYISLIAIIIFTQSGRLFKTLNVMAMLIIAVAVMWIADSRNFEGDQ